MINNTDDAQKFFANDRFATQVTGIVVLYAEKCASKCMFKTTPEHLNSNGFVMGGALYTLADLAFAVAANTGNPPTVTLNSQMNFLTSTKADEVYAEASCIRDGRHASVYVINITDSDGKKVAYATFTGYRKQNNA